MCQINIQKPERLLLWQEQVDMYSLVPFIEEEEKALAEFYQEAGRLENERTEHSNKKNVHEGE